MRKVIGIGETVLDIIFKGDDPIGAVPGGSVYNSIISLGRSGVQCAFISETGNDRVGKRITSFLRDNGVNADSVYVYPESKSPLSLAFLNENHNAEYIFYKEHSNDRLDFTYPDIQPNDIILYGSYYALNPVIRPQVFAFLDYAKRHGAILYYDVNFRNSHKDELTKLRSNMLENFELADIIRGSSEDFEIICNMSSADKVYNSEISFYCKNFIYTQGSQPVVLRSGSLRKEYPIQVLGETVSTIGAGDNFNAGVAFAMIKNNITLDMIQNQLQERQWDELINYGQLFAACACGSMNNYVDHSFAKQRMEELSEAAI